MAHTQMGGAMAFLYERLVADLRHAVMAEDAMTAVRAILEAAIANPAAIRETDGEITEDETRLFEDQTISIWRCRFHPHEVMPPHEHKLPVLIACYSGGEKSILFQRANGRLEETGTITACAGEVIELDADVIHAVTSEGGQPSDAIHVYFGGLMSLKRDLFDWDTGQPVPFTMDKFEAMKRPA